MPDVEIIEFTELLNQQIRKACGLELCACCKTQELNYDYRDDFPNEFKVCCECYDVLNHLLFVNTTYVFDPEHCEICKRFFDYVENVLKQKN